jgi:hypothetical protein
VCVPTPVGMLVMDWAMLLSSTCVSRAVCARAFTVCISDSIIATCKTQTNIYINNTCVNIHTSMHTSYKQLYEHDAHINTHTHIYIYIYIYIYINTHRRQHDGDDTTNTRENIERRKI